MSLWFGISNTALQWFKSYLSSRSFSVKASGFTSRPLRLSCGIPQGSVLGPLLFILYTTPLSSLINSTPVDHHLYADDTQLFYSFRPAQYADAIKHILSTFSFISSWMTSSRLCLNPSKTEFLLIGLSKQLVKITDPSSPFALHRPASQNLHVTTCMKLTA